jgi:hypothetical protein
MSVTVIKIHNRFKELTAAGTVPAFNRIPLSPDLFRVTSIAAKIINFCGYAGWCLNYRQLLSGKIPLGNKH